MVWEDIAKLTGMVIAWDAICLQLFILPFSRKAESLQKDYITDGVLDAALSYIDTQKLIPRITSIITRVRDAQSDKRRSLSKENVEELLQQIDYIEDLFDAQSAMGEKTSLNELFDSLQIGARQISRWGLLHLIATFAFPVAFWVPTQYTIGALVGTGALAIVTLTLAIVRFVVFHRRMNSFLLLLKQNRKEG
jgi:hypothetical protein